MTASLSPTTPTDCAEAAALDALADAIETLAAVWRGARSGAAAWPAC